MSVKSAAPKCAFRLGILAMALIALICAVRSLGAEAVPSDSRTESGLRPSQRRKFGLKITLLES